MDRRPGKLNGDNIYVLKQKHKSQFLFERIGKPLFKIRIEINLNSQILDQHLRVNASRFSTEFAENYLSFVIVRKLFIVNPYLFIL